MRRYIWWPSVGGGDFVVDTPTGGGGGELGPTVCSNNRVSKHIKHQQLTDFTNVVCVPPCV